MSANGIEPLALLKELRELTANAEGAQRAAWTDTWLQARRWFESKLEGLPVEHHYDAAGNHWVTLQGTSKKCVGYPRDDDDRPALMREGWEKRDPRAETLFVR